MAPDPTPAAPPEQGEPPRRSRSAGVVALALVGLALTAGITYAASTVVSQPIGLTSEPATVGDSLAPGSPVTVAPSTTPTTTTVTTTVTTPPPVTTPQTVTTPPPVTTTSPAGGGGGQGQDEDGDDD